MKTLAGRPTTDAYPLALFGWLLGGAGLAALILVLPNQAVVTKYVNDLLIFLDGAYRVGLGQVPNRDFHSALGPLVYVVPAIAARITGALGTAMPASMAIYLVVLAPALAHVISSRLRTVIAIPFAAFIILILAAPINLGEAIFDLSFGMFYNRIGWAAFATLLVMYLRPASGGDQHRLIDAAAAALLTLVLIYTKATYGAAALAFLGFLVCVDPRQRGWAAAALAGVAIVAAVTELIWGGTAGYIADLANAKEVSGERSPHDLVDFFLRNLADYVFFMLMAGLSLRATRSVRDGLFFLFCAGTGLVLISQNYQNWGIITLHAAFAVAAERLVRARFAASQANALGGTAAAAPWLMLAMLLPTIVHNGAALSIYSGLATFRAGEPFDLPNYEGLRLADVWDENSYRNNSRYLAALREGQSILQAMTPKPHGVFVLDFVSPFSSAASLAPPQGDTAWQHWGRNVNESVFVPPEELFRKIEVVMEPKEAIEGITGNNLRAVYGPYISKHFELKQESSAWKLFARTDVARASHAANPSSSLAR